MRRPLLKATGDAERQLLTDSEIDEGFKFIMENAPLTSEDNETLIWVTKQKNNPESPVFKVPMLLVKEAIANIRNQMNLVKTNYCSPVCIRGYF